VVVVGLWLLLVLGLLLAGRREDARALASFVPDCLILVRRLLGDPRVPRRRKVALWLVLGYLASPLDLVPDVIPVAGQLDDALLLALVLRGVLRSAGSGALDEHWPGPPRGRDLLRRLMA
jgi:uncharacterized membrane protein YkvA (DUF1232 family)